MKWSKAELMGLLESHLQFEEKLTFNRSDFKNFDRLNTLEDVIVTGYGIFDAGEQELKLDLHAEGVMNVPCAVTLEDVLLPFEIETHEVFCFHPSDDEEVHVVKNEIDLLPLLLQLILAEVPLKAVKEGQFQYAKGDGWEVIKEEDYIQEKEKEIDPRLAKLKEFKIQDD